MKFDGYHCEQNSKINERIILLIKTISSRILNLCNGIERSRRFNLVIISITFVFCWFVLSGRLIDAMNINVDLNNIIRWIIIMGKLRRTKSILNLDLSFTLRMELIDLIIWRLFLTEISNHRYSRLKIPRINLLY